jgi:hypothetical protein
MLPGSRLHLPLNVSRQEVKAMRWPSGDQTGEASSAQELVKLATRVPSVVMTKTS